MSDESNGDCDESSDGDHPALGDYSIDEDYIDVPSPQRADVSIVHDESTSSETESTDVTPTENTQASDTSDGVDDPPMEGVDTPLRQLDRNDDASYTFGQYEGSASASSLDEMRDRNAVITNDGRSQTRTMFYPDYDDMPEHRRGQYRRLAKINDGMWSKDRDSQNKKADNRRWIDGFCSQLELSDSKQERVEYLIDSVDLREFGSYSAQKVILGCIVLVEDDDGRDVTEHPSYESLRDGVGGDETTTENVRRLLCEKSPNLSEDE